jgi:hypothetical protein
VRRSPRGLHRGQVTDLISGVIPGLIAPVPGGPGQADADQLVEQLPPPAAVKLHAARLTPAVLRVKKPAGLPDHAEQAAAGLPVRGRPGPLQPGGDITDAKDQHGGQGVLDAGIRPVIKIIIAVIGPEAGDQRAGHLGSHGRVSGGQRGDRDGGANPAGLNCHVIPGLPAGPRRHQQGGPGRRRREHLPQHRGNCLRCDVGGGAEPARIPGHRGGRAERWPVIRLPGQDDQRPDDGVVQAGAVQRTAEIGDAPACLYVRAGAQRVQRR